MGGREDSRFGIEGFSVFYLFVEGFWISFRFFGGFGFLFDNRCLELCGD